MNFQINDSPYATLDINLDAGETIVAETGAMMLMSSNINIKPINLTFDLPTNSNDPITEEIKEKSIFKAIKKSAKLTLAPPLPCDILNINLNNQTVYTEASSFLASSKGLQFSVEGDLEQMLRGKSLFLQKIKGKGELFLKFYGNIKEYDLKEGESLIVDSGHLVAFEDSIIYKIQKPKDESSVFAKGEWIVCKYKGPGKLWLSTRNRTEFAKILARYLP